MEWPPSHRHLGKPNEKGNNFFGHNLPTDPSIRMGGKLAYKESHYFTPSKDLKTIFTQKKTLGLEVRRAPWSHTGCQWQNRNWKSDLKTLGSVNYLDCDNFTSIYICKISPTVHFKYESYCRLIILQKHCKKKKSTQIHYYTFLYQVFSSIS